MDAVASLWLAAIESQVEREHVHPRLAEKPELPTFGVPFDQRAHSIRL